MTEERFSEAMFSVVELAEALETGPMAHIPGCWEFQIDESWWIAANGHRIPTACSRDVTVPPFHVYIEWNGIPAGMIHPYGGSMVAHPNANEDDFIAAVKYATELVEASP